MPRPTKLTPDVLALVHDLHFNQGKSYPDIVDHLKKHLDVATTKGTLKVKMASYRSAAQDLTSLQAQLEALQAQIDALKNPPAPDLQKQILNTLNGEWKTYRDVAVSIFGNPHQAHKIRSSIKRMGDLIEKTTLLLDSGNGRRKTTVVRRRTQ